MSCSAALESAFPPRFPGSVLTQDGETTRGRFESLSESRGARCSSIKMVQELIDDVEETEEDAGQDDLWGCPRCE